MNTKITPEKKSIFLTKLATSGNIRLACDAAGISRATVYIWREQDESFAKAWIKARQYGGEALEDEAFRRGVEGYEEKVFYRGEVVDTVRKYSDKMLALLLQANLPLKYHTAKQTRQDTYYPRVKEEEIADSVKLAKFLQESDEAQAGVKSEDSDDDDLA